MPVYALADADLEIEDEGAFWIAPNAILIGKVVLKKNASVWWGAVLRADNDPIILGENSNVQDGVVMHTDRGAPVILGKDVTIGHQAMIHGCQIGDRSLIGIKATILDRAIIGSECLVGAHALVTERKVFEDGNMILGAPAKVARALDDVGRSNLKLSADFYVENWKRYKRDLKPSSVV